MSYNLQIVQPCDFVRLDASGRLDLAESKKVLADVARACVERGIGLALLDVRDLYTDLRLADVYSLSRAFREMGFRRTDRLAILHRYNSAEKADFFAMCAADGGWDVRAFEDFEQAMEWFGTPRAADCRPASPRDGDRDVSRAGRQGDSP
jgi:hypothetical protein